jgi:outer membrane protein assembly factor BamB
VTSREFELENLQISHDSGKNHLLCRDSGTGKKKWIKRLETPCELESILLDNDIIFIACVEDHHNGMLFALDRATGNTRWYIPGHAFALIPFEGHLYTIFIDSEDRYFLLKIDREEGSLIWHHQVQPELQGYHFSGRRAILEYPGGRRERISLADGRPSSPEGKKHA